MALRKRILLQGIVQGVGFRPFVFRAATKFQLSGFVRNSSSGVEIEAEGENLEGFMHALRSCHPPLAQIHEWREEELALQSSTGFSILESEKSDGAGVLVSPDIALCASCRAELADPRDRRHGYPFINCTDCGPRLTIIEGLPYDRPNTTMKKFAMCPQCRQEYESPGERRYHAQPISCFDCGPRLYFYDQKQTEWPQPLAAATEKIKHGEVVAIKGLGGYHLACLACSEKAVARLRQLKKRESKPFAVMAFLPDIEKNCVVTAVEKDWLLASAAPVMLLRKKAQTAVVENVAPGCRRLGFMVPYSPLHCLLLEAVGEPLVMTSANVSDEPIVHRDEARALLALADAVLAHDREILVPADDSVAQLAGGAVQIMRRSRGLAPLSLLLPFNSSGTVLGVGALDKTTFTLVNGRRAIVSQHIGSTASPQGLAAEKRLIQHYIQLFSLPPDRVAIDLHPLWPNRLLADDFSGCEKIEVQHHRAHIASLLAEQGEMGQVIGIALDGTGYGDDGQVWGGEFFIGSLAGLERLGQLKYSFFPSGDLAVLEPWRYALSLLHELADQAPAFQGLASRFGAKGLVLSEAIAQRQGGTWTSSCGRLFDAVAVLLGLGDYNRYDGELPARLQALAEQAVPSDTAYGFTITKENGLWQLDFLPALAEMLADRRPQPERALSFHRSLARGLLAVAEKLRYEYGLNKVGLSGGVFQNALLLEMALSMLQASGFVVLVHEQVPANDGGIALGQACLASQAGLEG